MTIGGLALVSRHVSGINVSQPLLKAYFPAPVEYGARGSRKFRQLIGGVKGTYVPRHGFVGFVYPLRYVPEFLFRVVKGGYDEGRYLDPDSFFPQILYALQNRREPRSADLLVKSLAKGLDVHVHRVEKRDCFVYALLGHVAVRDEDVFKPLLPRRNSAVGREFEKYRGLGIGVRYAFASRVQGVRHHGFGGRIGSGHRLTAFRHLGDFVILAMKATEVAPDGRYGIGRRAGLKVKKRLFFDRVHVTGDELAVIQAKESPFPVFPYPADAAFSVRDAAVEIA